MNHGVILVLLSSVFFAFVPNSAKIALDDGSSLFFLVFSRYAIGALILFLFIVLIGGNLRIPLRTLPYVILSSIFACLLIMLTYHAVDYLDVGLVMLILYCFPIGVAFISYLRGKTEILLIQWLSIVVLICGLYLMLSTGDKTLNLYGLFISFMGLLFFIAFIVTASDLTEQIGATTFNLYISLIGMVFLTVGFILPLGFEINLPLTNTGSLAIFANGLFYVLSWVLFFKGTSIIGATRSSMLACVEPLFAALLAIILLGQLLSVTEWIGFFIVLTSIYSFEKNSANLKPQSK
ncbi:MAG: DMT family transporter [Paracoccaceae bacterium]